MGHPQRQKINSDFLRQLVAGGNVNIEQIRYNDRPPRVPISFVPPQLANCAHCVWEEDNGGARIYLGNATAAEFSTLQDLLKAGVRAVVNCTSSPNKHPDDLVYCQVPVRDIESAKIAPYFQSTSLFLRYHLQEKKQSVLVHCMAGVSRSTTIVLAYLVQYHNLSLNDAYRHVKERRSIIQPNAGFWAQLRAWEQSVGTSAGVTHRVMVDSNNPEWPSQSLVLFATLRNVLVDDCPGLYFDSPPEGLSDALLLQALDFVWGRGLSDVCLDWLVGLCNHNGGIAIGQRVVAIMEGEQFQEMFAGEVYPSWVTKVKDTLLAGKQKLASLEEPLA